ncbi:MAG TPA: hypothetical protein VFX16_24310 [Pseudonocardiaceae bacterium]|nr:hypothetical protein [Pseudonocardiaceae bacterium]
MDKGSHISESAFESIRQAYPREYLTLRDAIVETASGAALDDVADIEIHADTIRLRSADDATTSLSFDISTITPRAEAFDLRLDRDRQTIFLLSGHGTDVLPPALLDRVLDVLRSHYWLVLGQRQSAANPLLSGTQELRELLEHVLGRPDVAVSHSHVAAAVRAMSLGRYTGASEFVRCLREASSELRRNDLDPVLQRTLDTVTQFFVQLHRDVQPVLAIRKLDRSAILRSLGVNDTESLRQTFLDPYVQRRLAPSHAITSDAIEQLDAGGLLALVDELREYEFLNIYLLDRTPTPRAGTIGALLRNRHAAVSPVVAPDSLDELMKVTDALARPNAFLFDRESCRRMDLSGGNYLPITAKNHMVGFFPGLGSRSFYQNLGRAFLDSGIPEVVDIYREAAQALGLSDQPERLLLTPENMPAGRLAQQGFIGAAFLVHSLALETYLRVAAERSGVAITFLAYTGESFGIITSAVASGAISCGDGVRIAQVFTPLMLMAADGEPADDPFCRRIAAYLPETLRGNPLVSEPYHVIGLRADADHLAEVLASIDDSYSKTDVEVHKFYAPRQKNVYVRAGAKASFDVHLRKFPAVRVTELKPPTTFLAHADRMSVVRHALDRFMDDNGVTFHKPHTPVVSNNDAGLLTTAAEVRNGILAITDEIMASQSTAELIDELHPRMVLELGLGNKSVDLLTDNNITAPVLAYPGTPDATESLVKAMKLADDVLGELETLYGKGSLLAPGHYRRLRCLLRLAAGNSCYEAYFSQAMDRVITAEMLRPEREGSAAFYRFLEIFQHTYNHRHSIDIVHGELVLKARTKRNLVGPQEKLGSVYTELEVIDVAGNTADRSLINVTQPEVLVLHFDRATNLDHLDLAPEIQLLLDTEPLAREIYDRALESLDIEDAAFLTLAGASMPTAERLAMSQLVYQYALFRILRHYRPAMFAQNDYYLAGSGALGWLAALVASEAVSLPAVLRLYSSYLEADGLDAALDSLVASLKQPAAPVISVDGIPLQSKKELEAATRAILV